MNPGNGIAVVDPGEDAPVPDGNNAVEQVFSNAVIWKTIGSYLNVGDLKACRLVNSSYHAMVMKGTNFLQRSLVSLKPHQITRNIFGSTSEPWKNVLLKFGDLEEGSSSCCSFDDGELEWLNPIISNVESLSLRMEKGTFGGDLPYVLKLLLNAPKKLRTLAMEPIFLVVGSGENFDECEESLGNLEEFEFLQPPVEWLNDIEEYGYCPQEPSFHCMLFIKKLSKLRVLRSYNPRQPIPPFDKENILSAIETYIHIKDLLTNLLDSIAKANINTLKHVTLGESGFWHEEVADMTKIIESYSFPSLESATFYLSTFHSCLLTGYILALPKLKELEFSGRTPVAIGVLNSIAERSDSLRKLKIRSRSFEYTDWQFLKNTNIEEFQLELEEDSDDAPGEALPAEALNCLPLSVRRLFVRGPLYSNPNPALARLNPILVTHLTFIDSGNEFADFTMKLILRNFKMLRKLNVTNANLVTDVGFVGSSSGSDSFAGLKGLRTLILKACGSITDLTLKEIRFSELRYLDLSQNEKLTQTGYESVLSNNPSLETLLVSCKSTYRRKNQMCATHPRLSSVGYRRLMTKTLTEDF